MHELTKRTLARSALHNHAPDGDAGRKAPHIEPTIKANKNPMHNQASTEKPCHSEQEHTQHTCDVPDGLYWQSCVPAKIKMVDKWTNEVLGSQSKLCKPNSRKCGVINDNLINVTHSKKKAHEVSNGRLPPYF